MKLNDLPLEIRSAIGAAIGEIYGITAEKDIEPTAMLDIINKHLQPLHVPEAIVTMEGGVVQEVQTPAGFAVRVRDFDTDGVEPDRLIRSEDFRDPYIENVWGSTAAPDPDKHEYTWNDKAYVGRDQLITAIASETEDCLVQGGLLTVARDDGSEFEVRLTAAIVPVD